MSKKTMKLQLLILLIAGALVLAGGAFEAGNAQVTYLTLGTGGTAGKLAEAGLKIVSIDAVTGFPEMLDGRVKTLHPKVHGGLLARRDSAEHMAAAEAHGIGMIDMVVVNLYAFEATVARDGVTEEQAVENIDIGGPSMLRSAAKNFESVTVVTDPARYGEVLDEMRFNGGATTLAMRKELATEVFRTTSAYDSAIWMYLSEYGKERFPEEVRFRLEKVQDLRYGENPHQDAAFYRFVDAKEHVLSRATQVQGKELSYNNILDTDACWTAAREFGEPCCVIVKHTNPCGLAIAPDDGNDARLLIKCADSAMYCCAATAQSSSVRTSRPVLAPSSA